MTDYPDGKLVSDFVWTWPREDRRDLSLVTLKSRARPSPFKITFEMPLFFDLGTSYPPAIIADGTMHRVDPAGFCTRGVPTGNGRPSCVFCWHHDEAKLSLRELGQWSDDGGRT